MKKPALVALTALVVLLPLTGARPAAAAAAAVTPAAPAASASAGEARESVLVTGQGAVLGRPDKLEANLAVEATAPTVAEALKRADAAATRMRVALIRGGVARTDLQTSNVSVTATRKDDGTVTGYTASHGLTATVRNLPRSGALLSAAVTAGGDAARLNGVSFTIEDDTALLAEARKKAFADARAKADLYAREAGRTLGRVVKVSEEGPSVWAPAGQDRYAAADSAVPIEPGRQRLTVSVTVEWALDAK